MKTPSRERLLRHRAKMQRKWEAQRNGSPLIYGRSVPPAVYDADYLWWRDQQLVGLTQRVMWSHVQDPSKWTETDSVDARAVLCFEPGAEVTIENIP